MGLAFASGLGASDFCIKYAIFLPNIFYWIKQGFFLSDSQVNKEKFAHFMNSAHNFVHVKTG